MKRDVIQVEINNKILNVSKDRLDKLLMSNSSWCIKTDLSDIKDLVIEGWFDFNDFYAFMVGRFDNATFVEIGTWKGKSIVYLAKRIIELKKNIKIFGIDTFKGNEGEAVMARDKDIINKTLYDTYCKNIKPYNNIINTIIGDSHDVYNQFEDESIDFLFIDGDHRYEGIKGDLNLWYPKVKIKGIIAGHDYLTAPGVNKAVNEFFKSFNLFGTTFTGNNVWFYNKLES